MTILHFTHTAWNTVNIYICDYPPNWILIMKIKDQLSRKLWHVISNVYQCAAGNAAESGDPVNLEPKELTLLLRDYIILFYRMQFSLFSLM